MASEENRALAVEAALDEESFLLRAMFVAAKRHGRHEKGNRMILEFVDTCRRAGLGNVVVSALLDGNNEVVGLHVVVRVDSTHVLWFEHALWFPSTSGSVIV